MPGRTGESWQGRGFARRWAWCWAGQEVRPRLPILAREEVFSDFCETSHEAASVRLGSGPGVDLGLALSGVLCHPGGDGRRG